MRPHQSPFRVGANLHPSTGSRVSARVSVRVRARVRVRVSDLAHGHRDLRLGVDLHGLHEEGVRGRACGPPGVAVTQTQTLTLTLTLTLTVTLRMAAKICALGVG